MTIKNDALTELRKLAMGATPGPWFYRPEKFDDWGFVRGGAADEDGRYWLVATARAGFYQGQTADDEHRAAGTDPYGHNAAYIAAASPSTILELLNALDEAERARDRQNEALGLALSYLIKFEPPDSRAVSDEFVAMAAVQAFPDQLEEKAMEVIRSAKSALATIDALGANKAENGK